MLISYFGYITPHITGTKKLSDEGAVLFSVRMQVIVMQLL